MAEHFPTKRTKFRHLNGKDGAAFLVDSAVALAVALIAVLTKRGHATEGTAVR